MKICFVTHKPNLTGTNQSLIDMLEGFKDLDVQPVVLVKSKGPLLFELEKISIPYKIIRYTNEVSERRKKNQGIDTIRKYYNYIALPEIMHYFQKEKFDVIHVNSFMNGIGLQAAQKCHIPYVCHLRDFIEEDHGLYFINENKQYQNLRNANKIIAISNAIKKKFIKYVSEEKISIMYDPIDSAKYYIKHSTLFSDGINMLLAGTIKKTKGQLDAIQAVEILRNSYGINAKLFIVGSSDGSNYLEYIKNYVKCNSLTGVKFLPFTNLKEIRKKCDIGLMCSSNEGMGRVTLESMLSGCLTIGADAGATSELIQHQNNGLLYTNNDPESLAKQIMWAFNNKERANKIALLAQKKVNEQFDKRDYSQKIISIYKQILASKNL